ncbi:Dimer_Tnp_hAT domain-containing protein [Cephalotus follicularis]|uniref:Dimer_Tnp_hAT domain-containing protein n=1 Tax=Cephalotus follicularis TaxID=3775 RepID=A0A1Q3D4Q7_CEPFO|nr:Dimer_Tnp_hAT domain-containing protein [Cephalotus follicularis]
MCQKQHIEIVVSKQSDQARAEYQLKKIVKLKKDVVYPLVYKLIKLALTSPVATVTVERVFSAMKIVKNRLRNRMGDDWLNDCLVTYIERDIFETTDNERIMQRFQNMKNRRGQL